VRKSDGVAVEKTPVAGKKPKGEGIEVD
jgi:hypothetical protein